MEFDKMCKIPKAWEYVLSLKDRYIGKDIILNIEKFSKIVDNKIIINDEILKSNIKLLSLGRHVDRIFLVYYKYFILLENNYLYIYYDFFEYNTCNECIVKELLE